MSSSLPDWFGTQDPLEFLLVGWAGKPARLPASPNVVPSALLDLDGVDEILTTRLLRYPDFRLIRAGNVIDIASYVRREVDEFNVVNLIPDYDAIYRLLDQGATLVLRSVHRYWEPVRQLCRQIESIVGIPAPCTAFYTPGSSTGLPVHQDPYEGLVLQTVGTKAWRLYQPGGTDPVQLTLKPGDILYIPSQYPHQATAQEEASVHVTYTITAPTWRDVLADMLRVAASHRSGLDSLVPFGNSGDGFAEVRSALLAWVQQLDSSEVRSWLRANRPGTALPSGVPRVGGLGMAERIDDGTTVRWQSEVIEHIEEDGEVLRIHLADRHLDMPSRLAPAIDRLRTSDGTRVVGLADVLDDTSRRVLVKRLVREGLLIIDEERPDGAE